MNVMFMIPKDTKTSRQIRCIDGDANGINRNPSALPLPLEMGAEREEMQSTSFLRMMIRSPPIK